VSGARFYDFFIIDDAARTKAFAWCAGISIISAALVHFALGADTIDSAIVMALTTAVVLAMFVAKYVRAPRQVKEAANLQFRRREVIKLSIASVLESAAALLIISVFDKTSNAITYSTTALNQIRSGQDVSPHQIEVAKQTITEALHKTVSTASKTSLADAYTKLVLAESYRRASKAHLVFEWNNVSGANQFPITVVDPHDAVVKNTYFENCNLDLTGFAWLDTEFVRCILRGTIKDLLLVNVSFIDCSIVFPPEEAYSPLAVELRSGSKSGIMFSSAALAALQNSTHGLR
jgi:membrane protein implicated in regulation of membrane protease activity